jgi:hypothetical protein
VSNFLTPLNRKKKNIKKGHPALILIENPRFKTKKIVFLIIHTSDFTFSII